MRCRTLPPACAAEGELGGTGDPPPPPPPPPPLPALANPVGKGCTLSSHVSAEEDDSWLEGEARDRLSPALRLRWG